MKPLLSILIILAMALSLPGQTFEFRTVQNNLKYLTVELRETSGTGTPTTSTDITDLQFEIRWLKSYGSDLQINQICPDNILTDGLGARIEQGSYYWHVFTAWDTPFSPDHNWVKNQWEEIGTYQLVASTSSGNGTFEIPPDGWVIQGLNIGIDGKDYTPTVASSVTSYSYPTTVYEYVWKGGNTYTGGYDENSWTLGSNWEDPCGVEKIWTNYPGESFNCLIPSGLTYYPSNFHFYNRGDCKVLRIEIGANLIIPASDTLVAAKIYLENTADMSILNTGVLEVKE